MPLADNDIKSELSYAYLHAMAARAGCECKHAGRHSDNQGIDAELVCYRDFGPDTLSRVTILLQLKATSQKLDENRGRLAFDLDVGQYEKIRTTTSDCPILLLVLQLPPLPAEWLKCSAKALSMKKCAYWVSLHGAPASGNKTTQRVFLPKRNRFSVPALQALLQRFAKEEVISYDP
jgi:hypothetical protein